MPSRYIIRQYSENMFLHVYNRGVEKRTIFLDVQDYKMFLYYCFIYLAKPEVVMASYPELTVNLKKNNMYGIIELHTFCLMPNHFHMLLKQNEISATTKFMRQLTNAYTRYFNEKYKRVGSLMQGKFKAVNVETDEYILHLSCYIHKNPLKLRQFSDISKLSDYKWSSYPLYINRSASPFVAKDFLLNFFSGEKEKAYQRFVEGEDSENLPDNLLLEKD